MFEKLKIQNFQSHKDTEFDFVPGINIIIGTSDSGKSAVFRALKWLMYNRPVGDAFCSYWSDKQARVELQLDDCTIVREREKSKQLYKLDSLAFTAFKTEVPEEIVRALNMGEVNFQQQFDRPFLLDISSGEVAQYFNKIAHLENIDKALKLLHSKERTAKQNIERYTEDKEKSEQELEKYADIDIIDRQLSICEKIDSYLSVVANEIDNISSIISQVGQLQDQLSSEKVVNSLLEEIKEIITYETEQEQFASLLEPYYAVVEQIEELKDVDACSVLLDEMIGIAQGVREVNTVITQIESDKTALSSVKETILSVIGEIVKLEEKLKEEMPSICPLCGNKV